MFNLITAIDNASAGMFNDFIIFLFWYLIEIYYSSKLRGINL